MTEVLQQLLADSDERHDGDSLAEREEPGGLCTHASIWSKAWTRS